MRILTLATTILFTSIFSSPGIADGPGHLIIVGGGDTPDLVMKKMIELAGGKDAKIVVLPQASSSVDRGSGSVEMFASFGADNAQLLELDDSATSVAAINGADLIWFTDGEQSRLIYALRDARLIDVIRRRYADGATVGGSGAGAAAISDIMISGSPKRQRLAAGNTPISRGLGLIPELIIDHPFDRDRMNRILNAVMDHPDRIGVGIDEGAAIIVSGKRLTVYGDRSVMIIDARGGKTKVAEAGHLQSARKIHLDVLSQGDSFDFAGTMPSTAGKILTACEESDFARFCTHQEMMEYLAQINASSQEMLFSTFGKSVKGRELVYAVFSRPMVTNPFEAITSGKPIVILDAGVHGDERTLRESNLILIRELAKKGSEMNALLDDLVVIMIPCLNPDGTEHDKRRNAHDNDINRDYIKLDEPETLSYVSNILQKWHPHVQIGGHNGGPYPYNISYMPPSNAASDPVLSRICDEEIFPLIDRNLETAGYKSFYYGTGNKERWKGKSFSPKIFRNYGGICNYISIVFESPRRQGMQNGIQSGLLAYGSILEYCSENPGKVMGVVDKARRNTIVLGQKAQGQVPVQMKYVNEDYKVSYLINAEVKIPGDEGEEPGIKRIITQVTNAYLLKKPVATKTRPRPYAYILPSSAHKAIELLRMHNITVEVLQQDTPLAIEAYVLKEIERKEVHNHPEAAIVTVEEDTTKKVMNFPKGTYVVRTGQVMGRMISHMLEPETPENILIWNTMDDLLPQPGPNALVPIYKLPKPTDLPIALGMGGNQAQFVSQTVATSMNQGGIQRVSITLKNTGTDTWSSSNGQSLGNQTPKGNSTWTGSNRIALPHNVSPKQEVTFTFTINAPLVDNYVKFQWQMIDDAGSNTGWFGEETSNISIAVGTPTNMVKLYRNRDYSGWEAVFGVGEYTTADLLAAGGVDNDVDSVRVASGYKVEFYDEDNFGGTPEIHTADNPDTAWHNKVSSLKVMAISGGAQTRE